MKPFFKVVFVVAVMADVVVADDQKQVESRLREALRSMTQKLHDLENDLAVCGRERADLKERLASAERRARGVWKSRTDKAELESLQQRIEQQVQVSQACEISLGKCRDSILEAKSGIERDRTEIDRVKAENQAMAKGLREAREKNRRLYEVGHEIIDWICSEGVCSALLACEPLLGLWQVKFENIVQDYEDRLVEQKLNP